MALSMGMAALAEENDAIVIDDGDSHEVEQDVIVVGDSNSGVTVTNGSELDLTGNVDLTGDYNNGVMVEDNSILDMTGDITVQCADGSEESNTSNKGVYGLNADITVDGNVQVEGGSFNTGVLSSDNSEVLVTGSVIVSDGDYGYGVVANGSTWVEVEGNVGVSGDCAKAIVTQTAPISEEVETPLVIVDGGVYATGGGVTGVETRGGDAIIEGDLVILDDDTEGDISTGILITENGGFVRVGGDMKVDANSGTAIDLTINGNAESTAEEAVAYIEGDLVLSSDNMTAIYVEKTGDYETEEVGTIIIGGTLAAEGADAVLFDGDLEVYDSDNIDIYVTTIETQDDTLFTASGEDEDKEFILSVINYIIQAGDGVTVQRVNAEDGSLEAVDHNDMYDIDSAKYQDELLVTLDGNYKFENKNANLIDNGDGTYTIVVTENGNLIFEAVLKTTKTTKKTLAQKMVAGTYGKLLTDADGNSLSFTAKMADGVATMTAKKEVASNINVTRSLVKALTANNVETLKVIIGSYTVSIKVADVAAMYEDEDVESVTVAFDPATGDCAVSKVVNGEKVAADDELTVTVA